MLNLAFKSLHKKIELLTESFTDYILYDAIALDLLKSKFEDCISIINDEECYDYWDKITHKLELIKFKLKKDAKFILENDPAANSIEEIITCYPGFKAIVIYRVSHVIYNLKIKYMPRIMSEYGHRITGTDIHPGAKIGSPFFIDHATGIVIGETTEIKNHVKLYQGVTLGALQVTKSLKHIKRHPTIEHHVTIYANATILGGSTTIGHNSTIGGNVWLTESVPPNSFVTNTHKVKIKQHAFV